MDYKELQEKYSEDLSKRSEFSKTFKKSANQYMLCASRTPLHYEDENGSLQDIDMSFVNNKLEKNIYKLELFTDQIGYSIVNRKDNSRIDVKLKKVGSKDVTYTAPVIEDNKVIWEDLDTDFDFIIECRPHRVRCWKKLKTDKAAKDVTFEVIEDDSDKQLKVIDELVGYDNKGRKTISVEDKGTEEKSKTEVTKKDVKKYTLKQTFQDKVVVRDPQTRVKSTTTDIEYPIMIDADVEVSIANTADDGSDFYNYFKYSSPPTLSNLYTNYDKNACYNVSVTPTVAKYISNAYTRFDGITLPQSSTIQDATLNLYGASFSGNAQGKVYVFDENDPNAPTAPGDIINKTTGIASNVVTTTITNTVTGGIGGNTKDKYELYGIDVSSIVQELVNSYDYSNEAMLFFYKPKNKTTSYAQYNDYNFFIYDYTWGSTKAPELVINYAGSGYGNTVNGVISGNIGKINGIDTANISKVNGA